jgi:hypothetical protein
MNAFDILEINPLKKLNVSKSRWHEFGLIDLTALPLSTKPEVLALVAPTTVQLGFLKAIIILTGTGISDRALTTAERNIIYRNFYAEVVNTEDPIKKAFKENMPVYEKEFFPLNKREYSEAILKDQELLTNRFEILTTKYVTELGIPTKTIFEDFNADYSAASTAQRLAAQTVIHNTTEYNKILDKYLDQMWKNMLVVAGAYADEPGTAKGYFKPEVLHARHKNRSGIMIDKPLKITLKPTSILLTDFIYTATDKIIIENTGTVSIFYFSTDVEITNNIVPVDAVEVLPGDEVMVLGSNLKAFLYVANKEISTDGKVELSLM